MGENAKVNLITLKTKNIYLVLDYYVIRDD